MSKKLLCSHKVDQRGKYYSFVENNHELIESHPILCKDLG